MERPSPTSQNRDIQYVSSDHAPRLVNEGRFEKLTELGDDVVEIELGKKKIC